MSSEPLHALPSPFNDSESQPTLITQGAEALIYKTRYLAATSGPDSVSRSQPPFAALKYRPSKPYRHPTLDQRLTKQRVLSEARVLVKLSGWSVRQAGVNVPGLLALEWDVSRKVKGLNGGANEGSQTLHQARRNADHGNSNATGSGAWLLMEWIEGNSVKQLLRDHDAWWKSESGQHAAVEEKQAAEQNVRKLLRRIGKAVAAMHDHGGVVHGDLTSSNIMVRPPPSPSTSNGESGSVDVTTSTSITVDASTSPVTDGDIVLIDFGLAVQSVQEEDRAVDLYVLERAFGSTHPRQEAWFDEEVLQSAEGYRGGFKRAPAVLRRLEDVRLRGRKRSMLG